MNDAASFEQTIAVPQDIGRDALKMAGELTALLDAMACRFNEQDLRTLRRLAAQGRGLAAELAELLAYFEGEAVKGARDLLAILEEE